MTIDPRFYRIGGPLDPEDLAVKLSCEVSVLGGTSVQSLGSFDDARPGDLCFYDGTAKAWPGRLPDGAICLVNQDEDWSSIETDGLVQLKDPRTAFFSLSDDWVSEEHHDNKPPNIHPDASVAPSAVISNGAAIGAGAKIEPFAYIGPGVQIGK
ncbi:MAG: hypothetical protein AAFV54_10500, partial [Pseudomonadota bacterium]